MFVIKNEFKTSNGMILDNIRNIHFECKQDLSGNLGKFITESHKDNSDTFEISDDGIYLFRSLYDKNKALRLYKDYADYKFTSHDDYKIVTELQKRQKNIKFSQFPTGIITIEDSIIGQENPFYDNSKTIFSYFSDGNFKKTPTQFYLEILKILKEMLNEGILYTDIHTKNFLIDNISEIVNIIDFEKKFLYFDDDIKCYYDIMINNLKHSLLDKLNKICRIEFNKDYYNAKTLEDIEDVILEKDYKLKVK